MVGANIEAEILQKDLQKKTQAFQEEIRDRPNKSNQYYQETNQ